MKTLSTESAPYLRVAAAVEQCRTRLDLGIRPSIFHIGPGFRMRFLLIIWLLSPFALSSRASAQETPGDCSAPQTQAQMNRCAAADYRAADAELTAVYAELRANLSTERAVVLRTAQRAWLRFRDDHCAYVAGVVEGGSMYPLVHSTCLTQATRERIKHLRDAIALEGA